MANLADLVKGFRANVREGHPCEMRFDGEKIQLYPHPNDQNPGSGKTFVGICLKPSIQKALTGDKSPFSRISFGMTIGKCPTCGEPTKWQDGFHYRFGSQGRYHRFVICGNGHTFEEADGSGIYEALVDEFENS